MALEQCLLVGDIVLVVLTDIWPPWAALVRSQLVLFSLICFGDSACIFGVVLLTCGFFM